MLPLFRAVDGLIRVTVPAVVVVAAEVVGPIVKGKTVAVLVPFPLLLLLVVAVGGEVDWIDVDIVDVGVVKSNA